MASTLVPPTSTATEVPRNFVGSGNVVGCTHDVGPIPVPYIVKIDPRAIPAPDNPGVR